MPLGISAAMFRALPETRSQKCTRMYTFGVDASYISKGKLDNDIYQLIRHNDNLFRLLIAEEALCAICF